MNKETGFLLSYIKYGDYDAILHCFTKENTYRSFFVKGIYAPKNKKKAFLSPFNEILITTFSQKNKTTLFQAKSIELSKNIHHNEDIKVAAILFFVSDFLNQILQKENLSINFYPIIEQFIEQLNSQNYQAHYVFLFLILKNIGLAPLSDGFRFLNPESGNFENVQTHQLFNENISEIWRNLTFLENPYFIKIEKNSRKTFLDSLLVYFQYHFTGFRTPISLEVVQEIFE